MHNSAKTSFDTMVHARICEIARSRVHVASLTQRVARRWLLAGPLSDVSKLRGQAVFLMGAGGSGKGYVAHKWLKYMPGGGSGGFERDDVAMQEALNEQERGLTNLQFESVIEKLQARGIKVDLEGGDARIPFRLYTYNERGAEAIIPPERWKEELPPAVFQQVEGLTKVVFNTPKHELPSYWRQVNPDIYKEELAGYLESQPGYVHEMSSEMSKVYFEAAVKTGDPIFVDGTGANARKIAEQISVCKKNGYRVSLILVLVPLTVNQIRNATRDRKVNPDIVATQWLRIKDNYVQLRSMADKSAVEINRNDSADIGKYRKHHEQINDFIRKSTSFPNLKALIKHYNPSELSEWGKVLDISAESEGRMSPDRRKELEDRRRTLNR